MSDQPTEDEQSWPTHCEHCGTALVSAVVDFDKTNADRPEMRPGEMVAVDYCPNSECPSRAESANRPAPPGGDNAEG